MPTARFCDQIDSAESLTASVAGALNGNIGTGRYFLCCYVHSSPRATVFCGLEKLPWNCTVQMERVSNHVHGFHQAFTQLTPIAADIPRRANGSFRLPRSSRPILSSTPLIHVLDTYPSCHRSRDMGCLAEERRGMGLGHMINRTHAQLIISEHVRNFNCF